MIKRLRKQFIRIAMLSVTIVMLILSLIVNVANYISTDSDLTEMLDMICENKGTIPRQNDLGADDENRPGAMDMAPDRKPEKPAPITPPIMMELMTRPCRAGLSAYLSCRKSMAPEMDTVITVEQTG